MVSKKIISIYAIGLSVFFIYTFFLIRNYEYIPDIVVTHLDYTGKPDGYGDKCYLIIAVTVNALLLLVMGFLIKKPKYANYPFEVTNENRNTAYRRMRYFMAFLAIITSVIFSIMIYKAIGYDTKKVLLITSLLCIPPLTFIFLFKRNK